ncbi:MAG TPA: SpoIIE family protein phosphatase [Actinomycetota bacterium]|jgi:serine phosphatase RsbU (regulator of sigma subunit)
MNQERPAPRTPIILPQRGELVRTLAQLVAVAAAIGLVSWLLLLPTNVPRIIPALVYLGLVAVSAAWAGRVIGYAGALLAAFAWDVAFLSGGHTLVPGGYPGPASGSIPGWIPLVLFFVVALGVAELVARLRDGARRAALIRDQMEVLASVSGLLSQSFDYSKTLGEAASVAAEAFDGICVIDIMEPEGDVNRIAAAGADPDLDAIAQRLRPYSSDLDSPDHPVARVLRAGHPQLVPVVDESFIGRIARTPEHLTILQRLVGGSAIMAPMVARQHVIGALILASRPARRYAGADVPIAQDVAARFALAVDNARLFGAETEARDKAGAAASRLALVSRASELLAVSLDYPGTFTRLAELIVDGMADLCLIDVRADDGSIERVAAVHADPDKQPLADLLKERYAPLAGGPHPVAAVLSDGKPVVSTDMSDEFLRTTSRDDEHFGLIRALGFQSYICVPLSTRGRILGTLTMVSTDPERLYGEDDLTLAREMARRAAVRIDNARLYDAEQRARMQSERARDDLTFLAEASRLFSSSLDVDRTLAAAARLAVPRVADWCSIELLEDSGAIRNVAVAHVDPEKVQLARELRQRHPPHPDAATGVPSVIRTGRSEFVPEVPDELLRTAVADPEVRDLIRSLGLRSVMTVPLTARERTFGAITLVSAESGKTFDGSDLALGEEFARRAAIAVDNARLFQERDRVAHTLQRSLLPPALPQIEGLDVAARYHPQRAGMDVGGDFYDVFEVGGGNWGVAIGDVCGKGAEAAAVMGVVRYTLRTSAIYERRPSALLRNVSEALLGQIADGRFCTIAYARIRPGEGGVRATIACGGHPLPFVVRADGSVEHAGAPGTLLGVLRDVSFTDVVVDLHAGDSIVLYTDGVIDERTAIGRRGMAQVREVLADSSSLTAAEMARALDRYLEPARGERPPDDAAFVILRVPA